MKDQRGSILEKLLGTGGLKQGAAGQVARDTGVPEATVYGVGSFFHLLANPDTKLRICTGLSCQMAGADKVLAAAQQAGMPVEGCSCLAACDMAPAALTEREVLPTISLAEVERANGDWRAIRPSPGAASDPVYGHVGPERDDPETLAINLVGSVQTPGAALAKLDAIGPDAVIEELKASGLRGRGGAGFPAHIKWSGVRSQAETTRYVVLNADEGEPGTFKDREIMVRRPDLVLEGLAIAARVVGAQEVYLYLRGEFSGPWRVLEKALAEYADQLGGVKFHLHAGHGAYICGEETALLEALEGKRGMPRLRPPFPVEKGLWGKPTLVHNVETIACVPAIVKRGGAWFSALGREGPGTKIYCISGHVKKPGVYELPYGVTLEELVEAAGGYLGEPKAFSPGGASAGFLPVSMRYLPLTFEGLSKAGSMLGSAGVVVLNDTVDMKWAARHQLIFFEEESCGQCAPCRIGTRFVREAMDRCITATNKNEADQALAQIDDVSWQMNEGSICGLGQIASLPLTSARKHFPEEFSHDE